MEERIDPQIEVIRVGIPLKGKSKGCGAGRTSRALSPAHSRWVPGAHNAHGQRQGNHQQKDADMARKQRHPAYHKPGTGRPKANGRAERAVGEVKKMVRRLPHAPAMRVMWWPMALRYIMETARLRRKDEMKSIPGFGDRVLIKKRKWRTKLLEPTPEVSHYLTPVVETHCRGRMEDVESPHMW